MLETLAIIAYRQPTTRAEIEALRGMRVSSSVLAGLQERGWVKVVGRKEVPGRPHLYGTGRAFLTDFGLGSLRDLPDSSQLVDEDEVIESVEAQLAGSGQLSGSDEGVDEKDLTDATGDEGNHAETEKENSAL
jgi:segregation and condensation protein B